MARRHIGFGLFVIWSSDVLELWSAY